MGSVNKLMERNATIQSVERAFAVLRAIGAHGDTVPLAVLAAETGLPKSTVSRLLTTMRTIGVVERFGDGEYGIGNELRAMIGDGKGVVEVVGIARPYLRELVDELGEDAGLAVRDGDDMLYIDQVQSPNAVQVRDWTGDRFPLHTNAAGYVMLSELPPDEVDDYLARSGAPTSLRRALSAARKTGYVWTHGAWVDGVNGVAAPIRDPKGTTVAVINLYGPAYRFPGEANESTIGHRLIEVATQVSRHLS